MTSSAHTTSRRTLVKGAAWAAPAVVASAAVPAYAASQCTPSVWGTSSVRYPWGTAGALLTDQKLTAMGTVSASLPKGAVITEIGYEIWVEQRNESLPNGNRGPGVYDPGNSRSDISRTCRISYSNVTSCTYTYGSGPYQYTTYGDEATGPVFSSRNSTVSVTHAWQDHAFTLKDGTQETSKAFRIYYKGDVAVANSMLVKNPSGCWTLPHQLTGLFTVNYSGVRGAYPQQQTIRADRTAIIKYTLDGQEYTMTRVRPYQPNEPDKICDSSASGGVDRC